MKLGTRRSDLALTQSRWVAAQIGPDVELVGVTTEGDRLVDVPLKGPIAKGFFTEALERGLLDGSLDLAVHSLKDLPVRDPDGLTVGAVPVRENPADVLIVRPEAVDRSATGLPLRAGASVGASSERRQALLRAYAPGCVPSFLRGNVPTRVQRLREGKYDAIVLAEAGLRRLKLDLSGLCVFRLDRFAWPPAAGQGALAVQCRAADAVTLGRLAGLNHAPTARAVTIERGWLSAMGGGCAVPFGAVVEGERWALGLARDGVMRVRTGEGIPAGDAALRSLLDGGQGDGIRNRIWEETDVA
jgi:hydroxymethylbilane synthase